MHSPELGCPAGRVSIHRPVSDGRKSLISPGQARQFSALLPGGGTVLYIQGTAGNYSAERRAVGMKAFGAPNAGILGRLARMIKSRSLDYS
jgi:hypothetical protein